MSIEWDTGRGALANTFTKGQATLFSIIVLLDRYGRYSLDVNNQLEGRSSQVFESPPYVWKVTCLNPATPLLSLPTPTELNEREIVADLSGDEVPTTIFDADGCNVAEISLKTIPSRIYTRASLRINAVKLVSLGRSPTTPAPSGLRATPTKNGASVSQGTQ